MVKARAVKEATRLLDMGDVGWHVGETHGLVGSTIRGVVGDEGRREPLVPDPFDGDRDDPEHTPQREQIKTNVVHRFGPTDGCKKV